MYHPLSHTRVEEYSRWKRVFDSHASVHRAAGLEPTDLWRDVIDANNVFFLLTVRDMKRARSIIADPAAAKAGRAAGVLEGEVHFLARDDAY